MPIPRSSDLARHRRPVSKRRFAPHLPSGDRDPSLFVKMLNEYSDNQLRLVARLYYLDGLGQNAVAQFAKVAQAKVSRLLATAREGFLRLPQFWDHPQC